MNTARIPAILTRGGPDTFRARHGLAVYCVQSWRATVICTRYPGIEAAYCTQQTGVLTRGMTSRAIQTASGGAAVEPGWMTSFLSSLAHDDLAPATLRGYRYDLRHFLAWRSTVQDAPFTIEGLAEYELIAYRQHMVAAGRRPATVNRRLDALRRLCRWARGTGALSADAASNVRPMRTIRNRQPVGLTDIESPRPAARRRRVLARPGRPELRAGATHAAGRAAGRRGRDAARSADITMNDRSGSVRIRQGKGLKARDVPLNATARRALKQHLEHRQAPDKDAGAVRQQPRDGDAGAHHPVRHRQPRPACPPEAGGGLGAHAAPHLRARLSARQSRQAGRTRQPARS